LKKYIYEIVLEVEEIAPSKKISKELLEEDIDIWARETEVALKLKNCKLKSVRKYRPLF